jgi:hypothetical protein
MPDKLKAGVRFYNQNGQYYKILSVAFMAGSRERVYLCQELFGSYDYAIWREEDLCTCVDASYNAFGKSAIQKKEDTQTQQTDVSLHPSGMGMIPTDVDDSYFYQPDNLQKLMLDFLDASSCRVKLDLLARMKRGLTVTMLESMALSMDFDLGDGDIDEKYYALTRYLQTRMKYENPRLDR